jgi:hypothetical protein
MIRLYFNVAGSRPWSVDLGVPSAERTFHLVGIEHATARCVYEPGQVPCAWIEFDSKLCRLRTSPFCNYAWIERIPLWLRIVGWFTSKLAVNGRGC